MKGEVHYDLISKKVNLMSAVEIVGIIGGVIGICGAVYTVFHYLMSSELKGHTLIENRLSDTLDRLDQSITKLSVVVDRLDEHQHEIERELAVTKKTLDALNQRVNSFDKMFTTFEEKLSTQIQELDKRSVKYEQKLNNYTDRFDSVDDRLRLFANFCCNEYEGDIDQHVLGALCNPNYRNKSNKPKRDNQQ